MPEQPNAKKPALARMFAAFAAIYLIWGSTYLFIRFAIATIPPFVMAGMRFLIAGSLVYAWTRLRGAPRPALHHWTSASVVGGLMLLGGNGGVSWSEQRVPSGVAALIIAILPLWMVLLDWARGGARPGGRVAFALLLGFGGLAWLVGPQHFAGGGRVDPLGAATLALASLAWALGSLYSRRARLPASLLQATAMEMLAGGTLLVATGFLTGEWAKFHWAGVSLGSWLSVGYLVVFGSVVGFTAYIWLLRVSTPAKVSTYAYVNPIVAMLLGWVFAGEALTLRTLLAAAIIVTAVVLVITAPERRPTTPAGELAAPVGKPRAPEVALSD